MSQVRVADYIAQTLADRGVRHVFTVTGGGAMHLNDAFGKERRITPIFNHHEQACAMAAEGYARIANEVAVINVTTGPGGINALNGVFGAYADSIPMLIISGQVKRETQRSTVPNLALRQLGDQEVDIIAMAKPITKAAISLQDPADARYELERALHLAKTGRPGPVWIDIPVDVQGSLIDPSTLRHYPLEPEPITKLTGTALSDVLISALERLKQARRPTILVGNGIRLSGSIDLLNQLCAKLSIPLCPAWMMDFVPSDHPQFCGIQGTVGDRAGNFVVQNSDFLLILGSRLQIRQISYTWKNFARDAYKVHIDIDPGELRKPTLSNDLPICADLIESLSLLNGLLASHRPSMEHCRWFEWARERKRRYNPVVQERHRRVSGKINPYHFFELLSQKVGPEWNIVAGNASACVMSFPTFQLKAGQRMFTNAGSASMGYDLPAALGASFADPSRRTLCLAGDGSLMMNLQELQTLRHYAPDLKLLVIDNRGYVSIRATQSNFFGRLYGESSESGVTLPNFKNVGEAFGLTTMKLEQTEAIEETLEEFLKVRGPSLLQVVVDPTQTFEPKLSSKKLANGRMISAPLEDMWPFLERGEFLDNMIIPPLPEE